MLRSALPPALLVLALAAGGCRDREIAAYRAPKDPEPVAATPASSSRTGTNASPAMADVPVSTASGNLLWSPPAHWVPLPDRPMRKASFAVRGPEGEADLSVTAFPGDTGGLLANLNRWRGQIALAPLSPDELEAQLHHLDVGPLHLEVVDFSGNAGKAPTRILGGVLARPNETWFFKLMGPDALVAREKPAFLEFLRSLKEGPRR